MYNVQFTAKEMEIEVTTLFQHTAKTPELIKSIENWNDRMSVLINWQELKNDADKPKAIEKNKKTIEKLKSDFVTALDAEVLAENKRVEQNRLHDNTIQAERNAMHLMVGEAVAKEVSRLTKGMSSNTFLDAYRESLSRKLHTLMSFS